MPVLKKKGALFAVYHDSPDKTAQPPPNAATTTTSHKKHVLAARSPTTRSKTKAGLTSVKPGAAVVAASAALQAHSGNTLGPAALARKAGGSGREAADKENLRALGMGNVRAAKMQVFQDADEGMIKPVETKPRVRRALGSKSRIDVQLPSRTTPRHINASPHVPSTSALTVFHDFPTREQENIPPPGADPERNPSPAIRRPTRKMTAAAVARDDSGIHDPESPYIGKPRLRKLQKVTQPVVASPRRLDDYENLAASPSRGVIVASSQPHPDTQQPTLDSSPLFTRPQTRKHPSSSHPSTKPPAVHPPSRYSVPADPILCDVSEAYGADPRAQPVGFTGRGTTSGVGRKIDVRMDRLREEGNPRLRPSTYGWTQISLGEYQAPKPPAPRLTRQSRSKW